jgi:hypothetical protein
MHAASGKRSSILGDDIYAPPEVLAKPIGYCCMRRGWCCVTLPVKKWNSKAPTPF